MTRWIVGFAALGLTLSLVAQSHAAPAGKSAPAKAAPAPGKAPASPDKPKAGKNAAGKPNPVKPKPGKPDAAKPAPSPPIEPAPPADPTAAAKKIFSDRLCASCHTVRSAGITRQPPPPGPDLSQIGRTMDASALDGWLRKGERRGGKPHAVRFLGDDAEWQVLANWLTSLK